MLPRCPVQQRSFLCSSISRLQPRYLPNHDADLFSEMVDIVINGIPEVGGAVRLAFSGLLGRLWKVRGGGAEGAGERLSNFFTRNLRERKITFSDAAKKPPHGQWMVTCPWHRVSAVTACTRTISLGFGGKDVTKRMLMAWCLQAPVHNRRQHVPDPLAVARRER